MQRYIILRGGNATSRGPSSTGFRANAKAAGASSSPAELSTEMLSPKEVAEARKERSISALAPVMPTKLIRSQNIKPASNGDNWGIEAVQAHTSTLDGEGATVAVLDTGIDRGHDAFRGVDINDVDFTGTVNCDDNGHGTHCAGSIFGRDVAGTRIGIARGVQRALIGKVLDKNGAGDSEMVYKAMVWALHERADVISMSLGFDFPGMVADLVEKDLWPAPLATSVALEAYRANLRMFDAVMGLLKSHARVSVSPLVVAATGNESDRDKNPDYRIGISLPAAAEDVLSVAAASRDGAGTSYSVAPFSNIWPTVTAPGVGIVSAQLGGTLESRDGTSMACPHVAGIAALWWQSIKRSGDKPEAASISAKIRAGSRRNVFSPGHDNADIGEGMVTAPQN